MNGNGLPQFSFLSHADFSFIDQKDDQFMDFDDEIRHAPNDDDMEELSDLINENGESSCFSPPPHRVGKISAHHSIGIAADLEMDPI